MADSQTNDRRTATEELADLKSRIEKTRTALHSVRRKQIQKSAAQK